MIQKGGKKTTTTTTTTPIIPFPIKRLWIEKVGENMVGKKVSLALFTASSSFEFIKKAIQSQGQWCLQCPAPESRSVHVQFQTGPRRTLLSEKQSQFLRKTRWIAPYAPLDTVEHTHTFCEYTHQHLVLFQQGTKISFKFIITQVLNAF